MADKPVEMNKFKEGQFITIDGEPCRIVKIIKSKPGKHGSTKVNIEAIGLFDEKRHTYMKPSSDTGLTPIIEKKTAQVVSISGDTAQLMDMEDYAMIEAKIPEEFRAKITEGGEVLYWIIGGKMLIKEVS
ncbi:MAG: translation initiation factor IF-5A [Candidatus Aenigmarchaeota archaeon]|nr:translation initiation factor IF-5A [Candidatus Aenigmarchaeota archaeon]